jgi:hypothetical protein
MNPMPKAEAPTPPAIIPKTSRNPFATKLAADSCQKAGMTVIKLPRIQALMDLGRAFGADGALHLGRGVLAFSTSSAHDAIDRLNDLLDNPIVQETPELHLNVLKAITDASRAVGLQGVAILESVKMSPPEKPASPVAPAFSPGTPLIIENQPGGNIQIAQIAPESGNTS